MTIRINGAEPTVLHQRNPVETEAAREFIRDFTRNLSTRLMAKPVPPVIYVTRSGSHEVRRP